MTARVAAGVPAGGQFAAKAYTEADVELTSAALATAGAESREAYARYQFTNARLIAQSILAEEPTAAYVNLIDSDSHYASWWPEGAYTADGEQIDADWIGDNLGSEFNALPAVPPMVLDEQGNPLRADARFSWLELGGPGGDFDARINLRLAAEAGAACTHPETDIDDEPAADGSPMYKCLHCPERWKDETR